MKAIEKDRAFFLPEMEQLLTMGVKAMEAADTVSNDLTESAREVSKSINRLPSGARLGLAKASADRLALVAPRDQYLECRDLMKRNIPRIMADIVTCDTQAADGIKEVQAEISAMKGEVMAFRQLLNIGVKYSSSTELREKLTEISQADPELNQLIAEYMTMAKDAAGVVIDWIKVWKDQMQGMLSSLSLSNLMKWFQQKREERQIAWMRELGYDEYFINNMGLFLQTEADRKLWLKLISRNYDDIYLINPDDLSPDMMHLFSNYCRNLIKNNQIADLEQLINGMLKTDIDHSFYEETEYGSAYLGILYTIADGQYEAGVGDIITWSEYLTDDAYNQLYEDIEISRDLKCLWGTLFSLPAAEHFFDSNIESKSMEVMYGFRISGLHWDTSGFDFHTQYSVAQIRDAGFPVTEKNIYDIVYKEESDLLVNTVYRNTMEGLRQFELHEKIQQLEKEKGILAAKYFYNTAASAVGMVWPVGGAILKLMEGITSSNLTKGGEQSMKLVEKFAKCVSSTASEEVKNEMLQKMLESLKDQGIFKKEFIDDYSGNAQALGIIVLNGIEFAQKREEITNKIQKEKDKRKLEWFGVVGGFETGQVGDLKVQQLYQGFYDVDRLIVLKRWEENGLASVLEGTLGKQYLDDTIQKIKDKMIEQGTYTTEAEEILYGGELFDMDIVTFADTIEKVEQAYKDSNENHRQLLIKNLFEMKTAR